jgi:hypothetical protein
MSLRSAVRGIVLVAAGAAVTVSVAALLSPGVRRAALGLIGKASPESDAAEQPTHIVLPDRAAVPRWDDTADDAIGEGSTTLPDVALTGS